MGMENYNPPQEPCVAELSHGREGDGYNTRKGKKFTAW